MRSRVRENAPAVIGATVAILTVGWLSLTDWLWTDYDDEARAAFDALVNGHLSSFLHLAPGYGGSLILRAPFVLMTQLWGGGELAIYRAAAAPCLIAGAALGVWLTARSREAQRSKIARSLVLFLCAANPITLSALQIGHPEELLGAVLCVAAVLAALRDRPGWAGLFLGLAVANKEWAVLAVGPVLLALPRCRLRAAIVAALVAGTVLAPLLIDGSPGLVSQAKVTSASTGAIFQPWQAWWFLGSHGHVVRGLYGNVKVGFRTPPAWIGMLAHPLVVAVAIPFTLACAWLRRRNGRRPPHEALLLLAILLLVRCVLDPWDISYYSLPFLIALLSWEALTFARPPVISLGASFAAWFVFQETASRGMGMSADAQSLIFLVVAVPALVALALALYAPAGGGRIALVRQGRTALPDPA